MSVLAHRHSTKALRHHPHWPTEAWQGHFPDSISLDGAGKAEETRGLFNRCHQPTPIPSRATWTVLMGCFFRLGD
ncbi:RING finger protein [Clarias magur]|uniref:RING finger protein n=1 Tax=Clarias magur TaxID=1594786 RepID=A0A8J4UMB6_CLAMG|nr:RING finger protein [Clarias magur]